MRGNSEDRRAHHQQLPTTDHRRPVIDHQSPILHAPFVLTIRRKNDALFNSTTPSHRMTAQKYNVGIIGYGWVSGAHIAAINATSLAQVTAICSGRSLDSKQVSA